MIAAVILVLLRVPEVAVLLGMGLLSLVLGSLGARRRPAAGPTDGGATGVGGAIAVIGGVTALMDLLKSRRRKKRRTSGSPTARIVTACAAA